MIGFNIRIRFEKHLDFERSDGKNGTSETAVVNLPELHARNDSNKKKPTITLGIRT